MDLSLVYTLQVHYEMINYIPPINLHSIARQTVYEEFLYSLPWIEKKERKEREDKQELLKKLFENKK